LRFIESKQEEELKRIYADSRAFNTERRECQLSPTQAYSEQNLVFADEEIERREKSGEAGGIQKGK
jgi:hypothetical protein